MEAHWYQGSYLKLSGGRHLKLSGGRDIKLSGGRQIILSGGNLYLYYLYILICALQYVFMMRMYMPCKTREFAMNPANTSHLLHETLDLCIMPVIYLILMETSQSKYNFYTRNRLTRITAHI